MEFILNKWLPMWKAGGKLNYTSLTNNNMDTFYNEMSTCDLEGMRLNLCDRLSEDNNMVAMNKLYEILNDHFK